MIKKESDKSFWWSIAVIVIAIAAMIILSGIATKIKAHPPGIYPVDSVRIDAAGIAWENLDQATKDSILAVRTSTTGDVIVNGRNIIQGLLLQNRFRWAPDSAYIATKAWSKTPGEWMSLIDSSGYDWLGTDSSNIQFIHFDYESFGELIGAAVGEVVAGFNSSEELDTITADANSPQAPILGVASLYRFSNAKDENTFAFFAWSLDRLIRPYAVGTDPTDADAPDSVWSKAPIFDSLDFEDLPGFDLSFASDPDVIVKENGDAMVISRYINTGTDDIYTMIIGVPSANGVEYRVSDTIHLLLDDVHTGENWWLSNEFVYNLYGNWEWYSVHSPTTIDGDSSIIIRMEYSDLDSTWLDYDGDTLCTIDTCVLIAPNDSFCVWHIEVLGDPFGGIYRYMIATMSAHDDGGGQRAESNYGQHLYFSDSLGYSWQYIGEIIPAGGPEHNFTKTYKYGGGWGFNGDEWFIDGLLTGRDTSDGDMVWGLGPAEIHFNDHGYQRRPLELVGERGFITNDSVRIIPSYVYENADTVMQLLFLCSGLVADDAYIWPSFMDDAPFWANRLDSFGIVWRTFTDASAIAKWDSFFVYGSKSTSDWFVEDSIYFEDGDGFDSVSNVWIETSIALDLEVTPGETFNFRMWNLMSDATNARIYVKEAWAVWSEE